VCCTAIRGVTTDIIIIEEASHTRPALFYNVIVPLLGVGNTVLLGIATPDNEFNFYSSLWDVRDPKGQLIFNTIDIDLSCKDCKKAGKAADCHHKIGLLPEWKSHTRFQAVEAIMKQHDANLYSRENLGANVSGTAWAFDREDLRRFKDMPRVRVLRPVPTVFVAVDPSGGGKASDYSVTSTVVYDGKETVGGGRGHCMRRRLAISIVSWMALWYRGVRVVTMARSRKRTVNSCMQL